MKVLGKQILLKGIEIETLGIKEIDHYEVAYIGDEVTKVKIGDTVIYEHGAGLKILDEVYKHVLEENIVAII